MNAGWFEGWEAAIIAAWITYNESDAVGVCDVNILLVSTNRLETVCNSSRVFCHLYVCHAAHTQTTELHWTITVVSGASFNYDCHVHSTNFKLEAVVIMCSIYIDLMCEWDTVLWTSQQDCNSHESLTNFTGLSLLLAEQFLTMTVMYIQQILHHVAV